MIWRDVPRSEWVAAGVLLLAGGFCACTLHGAAGDVERRAARRHEQLQRFTELAGANDPPSAEDLDGLAGLFPGHAITAARAPWGRVLELHPEPDPRR